jgi:hypothetical protein
MKSLALSLVVFCGTAFAAQTAPVCMGHGQVMPVNNAQIAKFKTTTPNGYHDRGHVSGKVTAVFKNATGHNHFEITLDGVATPTTLEVVYDMKFGGLSPIAPGMQIEACGDYITANAFFHGYKPSPDGAIIHWVHRADHGGHDAGFVIVNGEVFGQK